LVLEDVVGDPGERAALAGRAMLVKRLHALPVEAVVRGYIIGSGWKEYQLRGSVSGIALAPGLKLAEQLPEPIFTPSSKAPAGQHDENIDFDAITKILGRDTALEMRRIALELYTFAADHARARNILIADTKFEFGLDASGRLTLIDEALTSFDKQFVRDYLESLHWNKKPPAPHLPPEIIARTSENYCEALKLLTS
jgi:phosphoribosylaminoimidazole-succinocarboxamide synthase